MKKILEIKNLKVVNNKCTILDSVSLCFYESVSVFLCGTSGSGKTSLLKAISGSLKYRGQIVKDDNVEVVFDECCFDDETISDVLNYEEIDDKYKKIINKFITKSNLNKNINNVSESLRKVVLLCKALVKEPKILFVDNLFSFMSDKDKHKICDYVKKKKITLVNVSTDIEDSLDYDYMIVLDKGRVAMEGWTNQVLLQEKILKRLGIGLPFYIDLSIQLKLYGLIDNICESKEKLVGELWK